MKSLSLTMACCILLGLVISSSPSANAQVPNPGSEGRIALNWSKDYEAAKAQAQKARKPLLIDFTTDWCGWSKKMDRETFAARSVQKEVRDFVLIRINPETDEATKKLGEDFQISSYPTLVVANYKGEETGRSEGFMDEAEMLKFLKLQLPLYRGNPLGYKEIALEPSDPLYAALKLLPKPEEVTQDPGYFTVLDYSTIELDGKGVAKYEIRTAYYVTDEEEGAPPPVIVYNPSREKVSFRSVRILNEKGEGRLVDPRLAKDENLYSDESIYWDTKRIYVPIPALKKGQILDVIETREVTPVLPGQYFFAWNTGQKVLLDSDLTLRFPASLNLQKLSIDCPTPVVETRSGDTVTWKLKTSHRDNDEYEVFSAPDDYMEGYHFHAGCSPDGLAKWYTELCAGRSQLPASAKARVADIVNTNDTATARAQAIFDWVTKDIRYVAVMFKESTHQPHSVQETLKNGYGDCKDQALLLQALCAEAGIASRPVLLGAAFGEEVFKTRPAIEMFSHCILEATVDGKPVYMDATAGKAKLGRVPQSYSGQYALRIDGQKATVIQLPEYEALSSEKSTREITLNRTGGGTLSLTREVTGDRALEAKKEIKKDEVDKMRKNLEASYKKSGSRLLELVVTDAEDPSTNFVYKLAFTAPRIASRTAAGLVLYLADQVPPWLDQLDLPRKRAFQFAPSDWNNQEIIAHLPGKVKELPQSLDIHTSFIDFTREVSLTNNTLRITEKSRTKRARLDSKEAKAISEVFHKINDHQKYGFIIEPAPETTAMAN